MTSKLDEIADSERQSLRERIEESQIFSAQADRLTDYLSWLGMIVGLGAIFLALVAVQAVRQNAAARRHAESESARAEALEQAVAERTQELQDANEALRAEAVERQLAEAQLRQVAEDGGGRPADRRNRARFQQHAGGGGRRHRPRPPPPERPQARSDGPPHQRHGRRDARRRADPAPAVVRALRAVAPRAGRQPRAGGRHVRPARPDAGRADPGRGRPRAGHLADLRRPAPARERDRQPRGQRPRRDGRHRHPAHRHRQRDRAGERGRRHPARRICPDHASPTPAAE